MAKRQNSYVLPTPIPPLILVDTGRREVIDGKLCRILTIERASHSDIKFNNITSESIRKNKERKSGRATPKNTL